jgi:2',3'-cyclic-nucleotide 2'-phosphodiesterase (5'-nucleotidase family)
MAAYVRKTAGPKLVLDAGDWFQGTPEGALRQGRAIVDVFNVVGYDFVTVGNHEFDNGWQNLEGMLKGLHATAVCANVYGSDGQHAPGFKSWAIKDVGGVKIGIFGLTNTNMKSLAIPENIAGLAFRRGVDEAKEAVAALREAGATVIIAISHLGFEQANGPAFEGDQTLAAQVGGIDLIVGGHSHTALKEPVRDATHGTLIVQAGSELSRVGEAVLEIDPTTKKVVRSSDRLVDLWPDRTGSDPAAARIVAEMVAEVGRVYDVALATALVDLTRSKDTESSLGDWMTDCGRSWAGSDLALQNGGGIRADILAGPVTLRTLFNVMPFDNKMVKLTMKGKDVRSILEHGAGLVRIVQLSGAEIGLRRKKPSGREVVSLAIGGQPLRDDATYNVTTIDFLAKGGDGYAAFEFADKKEFTETLLRDVLKRCAEKQKRIARPAAGRLVYQGD